MTSFVYFSENEKNEYTSLLESSKSFDDVIRVDSLRKLWDFVYAAEGKREEMLSPAFSAMTVLVSVLNEYSHDPETIKNCTGVLWCFSADLACRRKIMDKDYNMTPALLQITSINEEIKLNATNILLNCSIDKGTHATLLLPEYGYMEFIKGEMTTEPEKAVNYNAFQCLFTEVDTAYIPYAIQLRIHEFVINQLISFGSNPEDWGEIGKRCLNILMYLSKYAEGIEAIRRLAQKTLLYSLLEDDEVQGIKACFLVANVYGREEGNGTANSLLEDHPTVLPLMTSCFDATINYDANRTEIQDLQEKGFVIGVIQVGVISAALKNLSLSDKNKAIILKNARLMADVLVSIKAFIDNAPQFGGNYNKMYRPAGGGGEDFFAVENFLELLLQLSFFYDDDQTLRKSFDSFGSLRISDLLGRFLALPLARNIPFEAKQYALTLYNRYDSSNSSTRDELASSLSRATLSTARPCHIMFSYAWGAKKNLVIALGNKLKELGYEVWRDEEGSSLVKPAKGGDTVDIMTEAMQNAHLMIVCVSPQYKDSAACRAEAKYGMAREQTHDLKIVYVMMDENYHPSSTPQCVDGWLGFMVGTEQWFPLWDSDQVESTAKSISELAGNNALLTTNEAWLADRASGKLISPMEISSRNENSQKRFSSRTATATATAFESPFESERKSSSGKVKDVQVAWAQLDPSKACYPKAMSAALEDIGLEKAEDLEVVDYHDWLVLSITLKKPQQKAFCEAMQMTPQPTLPELKENPDTAVGWSFIDSKKSKYPAVLKGTIEDLGVEKAEDLSFLEPSELFLLSLTLKKPQQKPFLSIFFIM
jgi:hypothetical protein